MNSELTLDSAIQSIQSAFLPLACRVELVEHGHKVRFRVFSPDDEPLLTVVEASVSRIRDPSGLNTIITDCRSRIEREGYKLEPWNVKAV